jgi:hypothetical protein
MGSRERCSIDASNQRLPDGVWKYGRPVSRGEGDITSRGAHDPRPVDLQLTGMSNQLIVRRAWIIVRIEAILERIVDGLLDDSEALTITLKSRAGISRRRAKQTDTGEKAPQPKKRDISFPGATAQEAWNFS